MTRVQDDPEWKRRRKEKDDWIRHRITPEGMLEWAIHMRKVKESVEKASSELKEARKHWKADKRGKSK